MAYAAIISRGIRSCPMLKCSSDRCVCAPQSLSLGTSTSPRLSVSFRMSCCFFNSMIAFIVISFVSSRNSVAGCSKTHEHPKLGSDTGSCSSAHCCKGCVGRMAADQGHDHIQKRSVAFLQRSSRSTSRLFYLGKDTRIRTECASWLGRVSHQRLRIFQGTPKEEWPSVEI